MVKNALQAQLLKAGLVDAKKAKKLTKQTQHQQRLGQSPDAELKQEIAQAQEEKRAKDLALDQEKQRQLEEKTLRANIEQMIQQHRIKDTQGDVAYQFVDGTIKKMYVRQPMYNGLVSGSLVIARSQNQEYALLPKALAERIEEKMTGFIINLHRENEQNIDDNADDPYKDYVIPDDLMW